MRHNASRMLVWGGFCLALAGCGGDQPGADAPSAEQAGTGGQPALVRIDGSSTVFPITEAVAEEFQKAYRGRYRVTVGVSGTGGGFKKFCRGETDISDASRPIKASERQACLENGIAYIEVPVALDALTITVHPDNDWVQCMSVEELRRIWEPAAQDRINNWQQVRAGFPDRQLLLFGPGVDSGTYDYFTEAVVGEEGNSRGDFTASEDDNVLVQGVAGNPGALGFFGLAYFEENQDKLKMLEIRNPGTGECVGASIETAGDGSYQPLSRPLFIYVNAASLDNRPVVGEFVDYYLDSERTPALVREVGYVPLTAELYDLAGRHVAGRRTGTAFAGGSQVGISVEDLLQAERTD